MINILIIRIGSIGDTMVSLPAFHLIREKYRDHHITLLTNSSSDGGIKAAPAYQLLIGSKLIDEYIEYPSNRLNFKDIFFLIKKIRALNPLATYYLMPTRNIFQRIRDQLFFMASGVLKVNGLYKFDSFSNRKISKDLYESEASRLIRSIGLSNTPLSNALFSLNLTPNEFSIANNILGSFSSKPFIAISIGAKAPVKDWGNDKWSQFLTLISELATKYNLVYIGSNDEIERCNELSKSWPGNTLNLCGKLNPRVSAAIISNAVLFVGHDSGPMHLASSVNIHTVSIFSSQNKYGIWLPYGNESNAFYSKIKCAGCKLNVCVKNEKLCIRSINPQDVASKVKKILF